MIDFFRSMAGRVFLILLCGIVASASLTWWLAYSERQRAIVQVRETRLVEQAEQFIRTLEETPPMERPAFLNSTRRFGLGVELLHEASAQNGTVEPQQAIAKALAERLGESYRILSLPPDAGSCPPSPSRRARSENRLQNRPPPQPCEVLRLHLRDGTPVRISFAQPRNPAPPLGNDINVYSILFLCCIAGLAYIVSRITTKPLRQLALAARELGNDIDRAPLPQEGTSEIRQASAAFNVMQERIRHHIRQRTHMLAAITHDLQTPLTRLRLRLEKVSDGELKKKLIDDLSQTQALVREGLDLARSLDVTEPMQLLDIDSLLDSLCADAVDAGQPVTLQGKVGLSMLAHPGSLRRCLANLVDNAVKYGGAASLTVMSKKEEHPMHVYISIRDCGPGIPQDQQEQVFEPFYRLETSRSRQTGGTGLGLTIARSIILQHAGSITLANLETGGLEVVVTFPVRSG